MKKILVLLLFALTLGTVSAQGTLKFGFNDADFTYFGSDEGYLSLTYDDDRLVMHLSDQPSDLWLKFDEINTPQRNDTDGDGQVDYDEAEFRADPHKRLTLAKLARCDVAHNRAEVAHERARLSSVVATYQEALSLLGFALKTTAVRGAYRDLVFAHEGGQRLRVAFSQGVDEGRSFVKVRMTAA